MTARVTTVMYHQIRDRYFSTHPAIKGVTLEEFRGQLDYLQRHYTFVDVEQVLAALDRGSKLPPNAALLTFDDGYKEHFLDALPELVNRGIRALFFPPVLTSRGTAVLDVNKIHFILASADVANLLDEVFAAIDRHRGAFSLRSRAEYESDPALTTSRYDTKQVTLFKRLLQHALPDELRREICDCLFARHVTTDERAFAQWLYCSVEDLKTMVRAGMYVGSHGHAHRWLDRLTAEEQEAEIDSGLAFLEEVGVGRRDWIMCYPYGAYDQGLIELVRRKGCGAAFTTKPGITELRLDNRFTLERLDTNDLPKRDASKPAS